MSVGLYFYPSDVVAKARTLKKSARGEYEITDLNNIYLQEQRLNVVPMRRGNAWLDAGTPDSLMDSSIFVQIIEKRQGLKIACLEEIAYYQGFISREQLQHLTQELSAGAYKDYLQKVLDDAHELVTSVATSWKATIKPNFRLTALPPTSCKIISPAPVMV